MKNAKIERIPETKFRDSLFFVVFRVFFVVCKDLKSKQELQPKAFYHHGGKIVDVVLIYLSRGLHTHLILQNNKTLNYRISIIEFV